MLIVIHDSVAIDTHTIHQQDGIYVLHKNLLASINMIQILAQTSIYQHALKTIRV